MVRVQFDWWGVEIKAEMQWLRSYLEVLEAHLEGLHGHPPTSMREELDDPDPDFRDSSYQLWRHLYSEVAPRLSRGAFVVMLSAAYESAVNELADKVARRKKEQLMLADIRGHSFLERGRKYFDHVLGIPLCPDPGQWSMLTELAKVRHLFAHANGRLLTPNESNEGLVRTLEQRGDAVYSDSLIILPPYARRTLDSVEQALVGLVDRTRPPRAGQQATS
jgi:hypothetical protein